MHSVITVSITGVPKNSKRLLSWQARLPTRYRAYRYHCADNRHDWSTEHQHLLQCRISQD
jgi:hypothetical protein